MKYWTNEETAKNILDIVLNIDRLGENRYGGSVINVNYTNYKAKALNETQIFDKIKEVNKEIEKNLSGYKKIIYSKN